jgi:hypothetical protein
MRMSEEFARLDEEARLYEGPDQEYPESEIRAVAIPVLIEVISVCLMFACAILWCGIGAGRI